MNFKWHFLSKWREMTSFSLCSESNSFLSWLLYLVFYWRHRLRLSETGTCASSEHFWKAATYFCRKPSNWFLKIPIRNYLNNSSVNNGFVIELLTASLLHFYLSWMSLNFIPISNHFNWNGNNTHFHLHFPSNFTFLTTYKAKFI